MKEVMEPTDDLQTTGNALGRFLDLASYFCPIYHFPRTASWVALWCYFHG